MGGSLSIIISVQMSVSNGKYVSGSFLHSSSCSTLFSIASAGFENTARQTCVCIDISAGRNRISLFGALEDASLLQVANSSTRVPIR